MTFTMEIFHVQSATEEMKPTTKKASLSDMPTGLTRLHFVSEQISTDALFSTTVLCIRLQEIRFMYDIFTIS